MMGSLSLNRLNSFLTFPYLEETESKFLRILDFLGITSENRTNLTKTVNNTYIMITYCKWLFDTLNTRQYIKTKAGIMC